ncbi:MAG TPA: sulfite exporter TauE/SafE family protein, partial [Halothiobacillus sp.]|nr:sulfite exporter TauE/SafE family protein [Halothiobacillus sp.]
MDSNLIILIPLLLVAGAVGGLLAGLLGVGGGIVLVPILFHIYTGLGMSAEIAMPLSVGTSLSTIIFTSLMSARSHHRRGNIDLDLVRRWAPWIIVGVILGTTLGSIVPGAILKTLFGGLLVVVALHMFWTVLRKPKIADQLPGRPIQSAIATGVGSLASMLGIGGGTLVVPILNLFDYPIHRAVGTASLFGFII